MSFTNSDAMGHNYPTKMTFEVIAPRSKEIKCFKCLGMGHYVSQYPNKRTLVMKADGDILT